MSKKPKGGRYTPPLKARLISPCLHCQRKERQPGSVWCKPCNLAGAEIQRKARSKLWIDRQPFKGVDHEQYTRDLLEYLETA